MRNVNGQLFQALRRTSTNIAVGWLMTRTDGFQLGFTSSDKPFTIGGVTYEPTNAFSGTASTAKTNLSVDNMNATALTSDKITERDLRAGLYDNAEVKVFWIDPDNPNAGTMPIRGGQFGELNIKNGQFEIELRALTQLLQQPYGEFMYLECQADFGDSRCKVPLTATPFQTGAVYYASCNYGASANVNGNGFTNGFDGFDAVVGQTNNGSGKGGGDAGAVLQGVNNTFMQFSDLLSIFGTQTPGGKGTPTTATSTGGDAGIGSIVEPTKPNGFWYRVFSIDGKFSSVVENDVTYGAFGNSGIYVSPTQNGDPPPSAPPGFQVLTHTSYSATVNRVSKAAGNEPKWPTKLGAKVTDSNGLTYICVTKRTRTGVVTALYNNGQFVDSTRGEPDQLWQYGLLTWTSGKNKGLKMEVRAYQKNAQGGAFTLLERMPFKIGLGDTYSVRLGCAKTRNSCIAYANLNNMRAFPDMPTEDKALATPNFLEQGSPVPDDQGGS